MGRKKANHPLIESLEIVAVAAEGKALGRWNDIVVFVPMAVPGDVVDVQVCCKRRRYMEGRIVRFVRRSPLRVEPVCGHFGVCGGCKWQNMPYDEQLRFKQEQVAEQLNCRQNIRRTGLSGQVVSMQLNALEKAPPRLGEFDCIVSNPPYIPDGDIAGLDPSVRDYEPHLALKGGTDGLDFYRAICENWRGALRTGGRLYFEVGIGQADDVLRIMRAAGFGDIEVIPDLNGIPRVVWGILHTEI